MKFPKTIFVKIDGDKGAEFLIAEPDLADLAELGERVSVAKYERVETGVVSADAKYTGK